MTPCNTSLSRECVHAAGSPVVASTGGRREGVLLRVKKNQRKGELNGSAEVQPNSGGIQPDEIEASPAKMDRGGGYLESIYSCKRGKRFRRDSFLRFYRGNY